MSRISTYVKRLRAEQGEGRVLLVDNGDILQGQPAAYYYNYVDTTSTHLCARMLNEMGYLCGTLGNHDIETGHSVYDRWMDDCGFAVLGANVVDKRKNKLYLTAYVQEEVDGVRIGVLGMVTPDHPHNGCPKTFGNISTFVTVWKQHAEWCLSFAALPKPTSWWW